MNLRYKQEEYEVEGWHPYIGRYVKRELEPAVLQYRVDESSEWLDIPTEIVKGGSNEAS